MKILLITEAYPPVVNSAARLFSELAEDLSHQGHRVTVLTGKPNRYLAGDVGRVPRRPYLRETRHGVRVHRMTVLPFSRKIPLFRVLEQFFLAFTFLFLGFFLGHQHTVIVYSPPLPLGITGYLIARLWRGQVVINVHDLYPQTAIDLGLLRGRLIIATSRWMERFLYHHADTITVHSEGNRSYIIDKGAAPSRVHTVFNWVDLESQRPSSRDNHFRATHGFGDAFVLSYAGVMGFAQGMDDVVEAACLLQEHSDIIFLLAGDGVMRDGIEHKVTELGLTNVCLLSTQPPEVYVELLAASDVGLVPLRTELTTPVIPGKVQSIMAAGRPILCSANPQTDAVSLIREAECGICVDAGRPQELAAATLTLYNDRALAQEMGRRGRAYAETHFDRTRCIQQYLDVLTEGARGN